MTSRPLVDEFTPVPATEWTGRMQDLGRGYPLLTASSRVEADGLLLAELEKAMFSFGHMYSSAGRDVPCVRALDERVVLRIVDALEVRYLGKWSLEAAVGSVFDRIDQHFAPLQESWAAARRELHTRLEEQRRHNAEFDVDLAARSQANFERLYGLNAA